VGHEREKSSGINHLHQYAVNVTVFNFGQNGLLIHTDKTQCMFYKVTTLTFITLFTVIYCCTYHVKPEQIA